MKNTTKEFPQRYKSLWQSTPKDWVEIPGGLIGKKERKMFKIGSLVEPDPSFPYFRDGVITLVEETIGPAPWKVEDGYGGLIKVKGYQIGLVVERFKLFKPAEEKVIDNWKNGLDLL